MKGKKNEKMYAAAVCAVLIISCILLVSCGAKQDLSDSKYLGTWEMVDMTFMGESAEDSSELLITLNSDGTAVYAGSDGKINCTWTETKDGFKLKGEVKLTFTDDGDGIKTKVLGVELHFAKK